MVNVGFGTDGWRGTIADDFTSSNLRVVVQAMVSHLAEKGGERKLAIGYDTRFMSGYFARVAAEVASGNGFEIFLSDGPVTTPMLSYSVKAGGAAGGMMITASHNPYYNSGVKLKGPYGGSALPAAMKDVEGRLGRDAVRSVPFMKARESGLVTEADLSVSYKDGLLGFVDIDAIKGYGAMAALDCMHGTSGRYAKELWDTAGLDLTLIRPGHDPYFGGIKPEPLRQALGLLSSVVRSSGLDIGFAADGDADRLGVVDGAGGYIYPHQVMGLLLLHMKNNRGSSGKVVKTAPTSSLIDRIAADLDIEVMETPVGFKHICELMLAGDVLIGGEENGGVGVKGLIPERDALLCALLLLEMMAVEGKGIRELTDRMDKKYGRLYHKRYDCGIPSGSGPALIKNITEKVEAVYGARHVKDVRVMDGVKAMMIDGSWVMFRSSGTEPLIRIYAESDEEAKTDWLIQTGKEAFLG